MLTKFLFKNNKSNYIGEDSIYYSFLGFKNKRALFKNLESGNYAIAGNAKLTTDKNVECSFIFYFKEYEKALKYLNSASEFPSPEDLR